MICNSFRTCKRQDLGKKQSDLTEYGDCRKCAVSLFRYLHNSNSRPSLAQLQQCRTYPFLGFWKVLYSLYKQGLLSVKLSEICSHKFLHLLLFINAKYAFIFVYRRSITRRNVHLRRGAFICENKLSISYFSTTKHNDQCFFQVVQHNVWNQVCNYNTLLCRHYFAACQTKQLPVFDW